VTTLQLTSLAVQVDAAEPWAVRDVDAILTNGIQWQK
jgi:hypothetical protein